MARQTTHTMNPLPFEHLDPHRFEDLVRQLIYDFRPWSTIEDTGRGGADDGMDVRAFETSAEDDGEDEPTEDRLWIVQCKREKTIPPKKLKKYIDESLATGESPPHGFILAAACFFSKPARDAFRSEMVRRGVRESYLWGRSDIEDMLILPKNDHLLFSYFGISLQVRRRSRRTEIRSQLAMKERLQNLFNKMNDPLRNYPVLIRDVSGDLFYAKEDVSRLVKAKKFHFVYYEGLSRQKPNCFQFQFKKYMAYMDDERQNWDVLSPDVLEARLSLVKTPIVNGGVPGVTKAIKRWLELPANNRFYIVVSVAMRCDRVVAVDEEGDIFFKGPHFFAETGPLLFENRPSFVLQHFTKPHESYYPETCKRIEFFPSDIRFAKDASSS